MKRRVHASEVLSNLEVGAVLPLDPVEAHHLRDVLRLGMGGEVELFDDAGNIGQGIIAAAHSQGVSVRLEAIHPAIQHRLSWVIASAIPKATRADWMVEKISELGAAAFIPLATARSVALPKGENKIERWKRIAHESAKQSRRAGVMRCEALKSLNHAIREATVTPAPHSPAPHAGEKLAWYLSTESGALPMPGAIQRLEETRRVSRQVFCLTLFIGPEGGWTDQEAESMRQAGLTPVRLTATILRVETAAVAAAAIVAALTAT